ncbi:MAG: hypothetical protein R3C60_14845 [Parvularculaceae bacterium]
MTYRSTRAAASETSKATTHAEPTYEVEGVVHYCVANMPGAVPLTSSHALNNATLAYGICSRTKGWTLSGQNQHLRNGLNVHKGKVTCKAVADAWFAFHTAAEALG